MRQFNYSSGLFTPAEYSGIQLLNLAKTTELADLLGLEVVEYQGDESDTVDVFASHVIKKSSIKAIKFDDDFLFFLCKSNNSGYYFQLVAVDSNFNKVANCPLSKSSSLTMWYAKSKNAILFRANTMTSQNADHSVCITKARNADGNYIPVFVYVPANSNGGLSRYILGRGVSDNIGITTNMNATYYTLISLTKLAFPNAQLVCDYVYSPTHMGSDFSPKRILLNGETWVYSGSINNAYPGNGLFIKLDE